MVLCESMFDIVQETSVVLSKLLSDGREDESDVAPISGPGTKKTCAQNLLCVAPASDSLGQC